MKQGQYLFDDETPTGGPDRRSRATRVVRTVRDLLERNLARPEDAEAIEAVIDKFSLLITEDIAGLISTNVHQDPIARQFVPSEAELDVNYPWEMEDPIGDTTFERRKGLTHRYPDRVLLKPTHICPVYCRFCFRRSKVGQGEHQLNDAEVDDALDYIREHREIWEIILTGGDPLILSDRRLRRLIAYLHEIEHVEVIRIHTRYPIADPRRVTMDLARCLRGRAAVYVVLHCNHPLELTQDARAACSRFIDAGIPMLSQTVLLRGVNDDPDTLTRLMRVLVGARIKPYYLHHLDLARGTGHFRTTVAHGQELMRRMRGRISGLCQPNYVLDIPGGYGKVPIGPSYISSQGRKGSYTVRDYKGTQHRYLDLAEAIDEQRPDVGDLPFRHPEAVTITRTAMRPARIIFANTVNELMLTTPTPEHSSALFASSPRKLWLAEGGDLVVTPRQPSEAFVSYVQHMLNLDPVTIRLVATGGEPTHLLAGDVVSSGLVSRLHDLTQSTPDAALLCYALDRPTAALAERLGVLPVGYTQPPSSKTLDAVYALNTKSGFREVASDLELPIPEGKTCANEGELGDNVSRLLGRHPRVIIKLDRSSNAYAHAVVFATDPLEALAHTLKSVLDLCRAQPKRFVVEQFLDVVESPSIELTVGETGVTTDYFCTQRYTNGLFSGMVADQRKVDAETLLKMTAAGEKIGSYLRDLGYRGVFDLDAVVTANGELFFTETNVRRTAGTFVHELVARLAGGDYALDRIWIADGLTARRATQLDSLLSAIRASGLQYDPSQRKGVLITSESCGSAGNWRYLIIAGGSAEGEEFETALFAAVRGDGARCQPQ